MLKCTNSCARLRINVSTICNARKRLVYTSKTWSPVVSGKVIYSIVLSIVKQCHWNPLEETYLRRELERITELNESERISFLIETLSIQISNSIRIKRRFFQVPA